MGNHPGMVENTDLAAQLRCLALEPEQARRDGADLLERERDRERRRRGRRDLCRLRPERQLGGPVTHCTSRGEERERRKPCDGDQRPHLQGPDARAARRAGGNHHEGHGPLLEPFAADGRDRGGQAAQPAAAPMRAILRGSSPSGTGRAATVCSARKRWRSSRLPASGVASGSRSQADRALPAAVGSSRQRLRALPADRDART